MIPLRVSEPLGLEDFGGGPGGLFDRAAERGQIVAALAPHPGGTIVEKGLPNAFASTQLRALLARPAART